MDSLQRRETPYKQIFREEHHTLGQGEAEHLGDFIMRTGSIFWLGGETDYTPFISIQVTKTDRSQGKDQHSFLIKHFLYTSPFNQLVQPTQTFVPHLLFVIYRVLGTVFSANRVRMNTYVQTCMHTCLHTRTQAHTHSQILCSLPLRSLFL